MVNIYSKCRKYHKPKLKLMMILLSSQIILHVFRSQMFLIKMIQNIKNFKHPAVSLVHKEGDTC